MSKKVVKVQKKEEAKMNIAPFEKATLVKMIDEERVDDVKKYIKTYFFKVLKPVCIFYYDAREKSYYQISDEEFSKRFVTPTMTYKITASKVVSDDKIVSKFRTCKYNEWFRNEDTDDYCLTFDVTKGKIFEENGQKFINLFKGFKYADSIPPKESKHITDGLNMIWSHISDVICSGDQSCFDYVKKWICHFINGRKMKTALYLKGQQGAGKSTVPNFLIDVIGSANAFKTQSNNCLVNRFNAELQGVTLLVLEELKCNSASEWKVMNSSLNVMITESLLSIEAKGKDAINIKNHISIIITSNDSPIQLNQKDRRYMMSDISDKRIGDAEYFNKLYEYLYDEEIQKAFYFYCLDFARKNEFSEQAELREVSTSAKTEVLIKHLHPLYSYLRKEYVLKKKSLDIFLKDLTNNVNSYNNSQLMPIEVSRLLKEAGIIGKSSTGNRMRYKMTSDEMLQLFKKNKWIHDDDEFEVIENQDMNDPFESVLNACSKFNGESITISKEKFMMMYGVYEKMKRELEMINDDDKEEKVVIPSKNIMKKVVKKITTKTAEEEDIKSDPPLSKRVEVTNVKIDFLNGCNKILI